MQPIAVSEVIQSKRGLDVLKMIVEADRFQFNQRSSEQRVEMILQAEFEDADVRGNA